MKLDVSKAVTYWTIKSMKFREWAINNPKKRLTLYYLFFPITYTFGALSLWFIKWITFKMLDKAIKDKNDNHILQISAQHLKNMAEVNKWKIKVSKKWFLKSMKKHEQKLYNYSIYDKTKMSFDYFRTLIDVYLNYNIIGGGIMSSTEDTIIEIN